MWYWGCNPLILTFDPNFQRDIQVGHAKVETPPAKSNQDLSTWHGIQTNLPLHQKLNMDTKKIYQIVQAGTSINCLFQARFIMFIKVCL